MNKLKLITLTVLIALIVVPGYSQDPVRVMTFNIRYGLADDGDNSWQYRKGLVMEVIRDHAPDLLGLQDALRFQLDAICDQFPEYGRVGIGRDPGGEGEYAAILYRRSRFDVQDAGTFWLSETPDEPSTHWGNRHLRICTWARLLDRSSGEFVYFYNTHYDHQSQPARLNSSKLLAKTILNRRHIDPVIVTGDFNADEENPAIACLKQEDTSNDKKSLQLRDSFRVLHPDEKEVGTFNSFIGTSDRGKIDYVFVDARIKVLQAGIVRFNQNGRYPSDHYPVEALLQAGIDP
jgi:endonuclease/exonuclease/phosphatase family metal-dependent hydrolase